VEVGQTLLFQLSDGTEVGGYVLSVPEDGVLLRSELGELFLSHGEIEEVSEPLARSLVRPYEVSGSRRFDPSLNEAGRWRRRWIRTVVYRDYLESRLQLTDSRRRWVGPVSLGYRQDLLSRRDEQAFFALRPGLPREPLTVREFLSTAGDAELALAVGTWERRALTQMRMGAVCLVAATALVVLGSGLNYAGSPDGLGMGGEAYGAPVLGLAIGGFVAGTALAIRGTREYDMLAENDLSIVMSRSQAWKRVRRHNGELRSELGLPDDERLDAP